MKKELLLLYLLTSFFLPIRISSQTDSLSDIFPLEVGNNWEYSFKLIHGLILIHIVTVDTGKVKYSIYDKNVFQDSIVWKFQQVRDFTRTSSSNNGTSSTQISDSANFDIVEKLEGMHELHLTRNSVLTAYPFMPRAPDSERFFRYANTDSCGFAAIRLIPMYTADYRVYKDLGIIETKYNMPLQDPFYRTAFYFTPFFDQLEPANNTIVMPPITFRWVNTVGIKPYTFQIAKDSAFNEIYINTTTSSSTLTLDSLDFSTDYFWRVKVCGINGCDACELISQENYFRTNHPDFETNSKLSYPLNNTTGLPKTDIEFKWTQVKYAQSYTLQISTDSTFLTSVLNYSLLIDTMKVIDLNFYDTWYYWRVKTISGSGNEFFSPVWRFKTLYAPWSTNAVLISPSNNSLDVETTVALKWSHVPFARSYSVELSSDSTFTTIDIKYDGLTDTLKTIDSLRYNCQYFWRVKTINLIGNEYWSPTWKFRTVDFPAEFYLSQNYPNPFNPTTVISYHLPAGKAGLPAISKVQLKVYDVLGREVATLVNEEKPAGSYEVTFSREGLPSGAYFYSLHAGDFHQTKKMLLLK